MTHKPTLAGIPVNGRTCRWPSQPVVVVCVDGCEPDCHAMPVAT